MISISTCPPLPLPSTDLFNIILQNQTNYEAEILKKTFENFIHEKFRKPISYSTKPNIPGYESKKLMTAKIEYNELFRKQLETEMPDLYAIYINAYFGGTLGSSENGIVVIGTGELRNPQILANFGSLNETSDGCIFAPDHWSLLKNDLMILGAVQAHKAFLLQYPTETSEPSVEDALFWNETKRSPTTLAREVLMIHAAGYQKLSYKEEQKLGKVFVCADPKTANAFNLEKANLAICDLAKKSKFLRVEPFFQSF